MKKLLTIFGLLLLIGLPISKADIATIGDEQTPFTGLQRNPKADKIQNGAHSVFENVYIKDGNIQVVKGRDRLNDIAHSDTTVNGMTFVQFTAASTSTTSNNTFLLHADGNDSETIFTDAGQYSLNLTAYGNAITDTAQKKFGTASAYFDGTNDYVYASDNEAFDLGTSDFTIDAWIRLEVASQAFGIMGKATSTTDGWYVMINNTSGPVFRIYAGGTFASVSISALSANQWYHIAVVRSSNYIKFFIDGTQVGSDVATTANFDGATTTFKVGYGSSTHPSIQGWIDEARILKDSAAWTSNFTPPTSEYGSNSSSDTALLHFTGTDGSTTITDSGANNLTFSALGNAQIDTAQFKFGDSSLLLDGTGDYVSTPDSSLFDFGSGDFTIDGWVRLAVQSQGFGLVSKYASSTGWIVHIDNNSQIFRLYNGASYVQVSIAQLSADTWIHWAVVRDAGYIKFFINGVQQGISQTAASTYNGASTALLVGYDNAGTYLNGWLDEVRILKGTAVWTTNFSVPTQAYGGYSQQQTTTTSRIVVAESTNLVSYDTNFSDRQVLLSNLISDNWDFMQTGSSLYALSLANGLYKWDGITSAIQITGVGAPTMTTVSGTSSAGGMSSGIADQCGCNYTGTGHFTVSGADAAYSYKTVYFSSLVGIESEPSGTQTVSLTHGTCSCSCSAGAGDCASGGGTTRTSHTLPSSVADPFNTYRVYRTTAGGSDYFLVGEQASGTFYDGKPDASLADALDTSINTIDPPDASLIANYKGTIFIAQNQNINFTRIPVESITNADKYWLESDMITVSGDSGSITGLHSTTDSLLIFTTKTIQELTGFGVQSFRLRVLQRGFGSVNDDVIETDTQGDIIFFAGVQGVYKLRTFQQPQDEITGAGIEAQRITMVKLSSPILDDVFKGIDSEIDLDPYTYNTATAYYDLEHDLYFLFIDEHCFIFDNKNQSWSYIPAIIAKDAIWIPSSEDSSGRGIFLDDMGYFWHNWTGYETSGLTGTVTGNPTSSTSNTLTDTTATFNTANDGLKGMWVFVDNENGEWRQILSNTATQITINTNWITNPISSDDYYIGYIIPHWKTKQYQLTKVPTEANLATIWLMNNKAPSTQDLEFYTYENKSDTPSRQLSGVIDLAQKFIHKVGARIRGSWLQWEFRSFVYNTSDTIDPPVDITGYAAEFTPEEAR